MSLFRMRTPRTYGSGYRWKVLAAGVAANASFSAAFSGLPTTAVLLRSGYQLDNHALGLVLGLMALGIALSELPWGLLTDRWGDRPVLLTGLVSTAMALVAMALFTAPSRGHISSLGVLGSGLVLVGLLGGSVNGASGRAIMTWFQASERGLAMSIRQTAIPLGGGLGALLLPTIALQWGFVAVYGALALLCAASAWLTWCWLHEPPVSVSPVSPSGVAPKALGPGPLRDRRVWRMVLGIGVMCAPQSAVISFGTVFLHDFGRAAVVMLTVTMVAVQMGAMVLRVWSGYWTDRHGNRPVFLRVCIDLSIALFLALSLAVWWLGSPTVFFSGTGLVLIALLVACGVCVSGWNGVAYAELATLAGAQRAGTALGMGNTSVFIMLFLTPLSIPYLQAWQGWIAVWLAAALCAWLARFLLVGNDRLPRLRVLLWSRQIPRAMHSARSPRVSSYDRTL